MTSEGTGYAECQLSIIQHFILSIKLCLFTLKLQVIMDISKPLHISTA